VKKLLLFVLPVALLLLAGCRRNHPPEVTAVSVGPEILLEDTTYTFAAVAADPDGDSVSVRFDWGDSTVSDWTDWFASGDTVSSTHVWHYTGTYKVIAQARDQKLSSSNWSDAPSTTILVRRTPALPAEPSGPDRGGQDSSYAFAAAALQPDSAMVAIRFAWGDGDTSEWSAFVASGESVSMNHAWTAPDTYAVTAQAKDTGNAPSRWSAPHNVVIRPPDTMRIWRFQLAAPAASYSSPAIGPDGTIYVGSADSAIYAINADGTLRWRYLTQGPVRSSPAIAADGTVYVGSTAAMYALDPNGIVKWRPQISGTVRSSPAIGSDGTVYVGTTGNFLYAINPDGTVKWSFVTNGDVTSSPTIAADGTIYFGSFDNYFYALNPDGTLKWRNDIRANTNYASAAVGSDGTVYCGSDENKFSLSFYAYNPDGSQRWARSTDGDIRSSPAIAADGSIYVGSADNSLYALNPDSTLKWRYETGSNILYSSPTIGSDGTIYVGSDDNYLHALNPDGTLKWRYETDGNIRSAPTIGPDGTIYFASGDGHLYALKGTGTLADSPWPKFHHDLRNTGRVGGGR